MSVRKAHNSGRNHLRNVVEYYQRKWNRYYPDEELNAYVCLIVLQKSARKRLSPSSIPSPLRTLLKASRSPTLQWCPRELSHLHSASLVRTLTNPDEPVNPAPTPDNYLLGLAGQGPPPFGIPPPGAPGAPALPMRMSSPPPFASPARYPDPRMFYLTRAELIDL